MDGIILIAFFIHGAIFATFNWIVAVEKNRDTVGWTVAGFFFGIVAMIPLAGLSTLEKRNIESSGGDEGLTRASGADREPAGRLSDDGQYWICPCGTKNQYLPAKAIQNCSNCRTNRDFALGR